MHSSILSFQSILKNIKYKRNTCTVCKGMNLGLLAELTVSHFQCFCNQIWRPLLAKRQNAGFWALLL